MKNLIVIIFTLLFFSLANADIKKQVASLSIEIAEKLLKEKLSDDNKQMQIVEELLKDVKLK